MLWSRNWVWLYCITKSNKNKDYKNQIHPEQVFNHEIINWLKKKLKVLSDIENFMVILLAGLMGFIDLGDVTWNYATLEEINVIAFHLLSFLDQSIINPFELRLADFASKMATFSQIFTLP